jgi:hypothetical protein
MSIYAAIGRGASSKVLEYFPNLTPAVLPPYVLSIFSDQLSSYWIAGYFYIYCTFDCVVDTCSELKGAIFSKAVPIFTFSRTGELALMRLLSNYFSGNLKIRGGGRVDVVVSGIASCSIVARLFLVYSLSAPKDREFKVWNEINIVLNSIPSRSGELNTIIHSISVLTDELKSLRGDSS